MTKKMVEYQLPYIPLVIKAEMNKGSREWFTTASLTTPDSLDERTSLMLFQDWIARIKSGVSERWLGEPMLPYLSVAHYPSLGGYGVAGMTEMMQVKKNADDVYEFVARGVWDDGKIGVAAYEAVLMDMDRLRKVQRGEGVREISPTRISAAWWDVEHQHGDYVFKRQSLTEKCPICQSGYKGKVYRKGQAEHWALTRIPIHKQTSIKVI